MAGGTMSTTRLTENMLRIYEGLREEDRAIARIERFKQAARQSGLDIENLINEIEEKPYRSEVEEDPIGQAKRQEEINN